ncbi:MAG: HAMP domain-containing histidine kinase [Phycisphaerae bacterium]|nr:HAMP domain-containing histidine kinase [Phycisphaerae bacterium]
MDLRYKFGLLIFIYVVSLSANFGMSAWGIAVYFDSAFHDFQSEATEEEQIGQLRQLLRRQRELLDDARDPADLAKECEDLQYQFSEAMLPILSRLSEDPGDTRGQAIEWALQDQKTAAQQFLARRSSSQPAGELSPEEEQAFVQLDLLLLETNGLFSQKRERNVAEAARIQEQVMTILVVNTAVGGVLCAVGVFFVRRWVMNPIADLREATKQISHGNFEYRIRPKASDELGRLAGEVNQMSSTIIEMQTKMVEQERLAAAGEMVTRLAHNIRNPLAGIRGLAEATIQSHPDDEQTTECQKRIINTVDRFEKWLRDLQQSVSPLELNLQPVAIGEVLNSVVTALRPMLDRRGIDVQIEVDRKMGPVQLDSLHFEQALVSLVTNAVQASEKGQSVRVAAEPIPESRGRWRLTVEDHGVGIPHELHHKIFLPYFTTKPDGNGIGLAMANKVVRLHGGELKVQSELGKGSRFDALMPGLISEN